MVTINYLCKLNLHVAVVVAAVVRTLREPFMSRAFSFRSVHRTAEMLIISSFIFVGNFSLSLSPSRSHSLCVFRSLCTFLNWRPFTVSVVIAIDNDSKIVGFFSALNRIQRHVVHIAEGARCLCASQFKWWYPRFFFHFGRQSQL